MVRTQPPQEGAGAARECDALHGLFDADQETFQQKVIIVVLPGGTDKSVPYDLSRVPRRTVDTISVQGVEHVLRLVLRKPRHARHTDKVKVDLPPYDSQPDIPENEGQPTTIPGMPAHRAQHLAAERARHQGDRIGVARNLEGDGDPDKDEI
ncbi:hypothetical protein GCM10029992_36820 [Glycomyces albus]